MRYLLLILSLVVLSCNSVKRAKRIEARNYSKCVKYAPYCVKADSITTITIDTIKVATAPDTIRLKGETIVLNNPCAELCDSFGKIRKGFIRTTRTKDNVVTTLREVNGTLESDCDVEGYIKKNDSLLVEIRRLKTTILNTVPVALPETFKQKLYRKWFFLSVFALIIIFFLRHLAK